MRRDVKVQNAPPLVGQDQEHVQNLETDRGHCEKVDGDKLLNVIIQKGTPSLAGWLPRAGHVLADTGLADVDAEFE